MASALDAEIAKQIEMAKSAAVRPDAGSQSAALTAAASSAAAGLARDPAKTAAASSASSGGAAASGRGREESAREEELQRQEKAVRDALGQRLAAQQEESRRLATVQQELEELDNALRKDVVIIRTKIEACGKDLKRKEEAYLRSKAAFERDEKAFRAAERMKSDLSGHLALLLRENEQRKLDKLASLAQQLDGK